MTIQALKRKKQELLASQVSRIASDTNENLLRVNLSKFFTDLEHEIQSALLEYWNDHMLLQGQVNLILASIHEKHQEYYELIMKHKLQEFHRAEQMGKRLVKRQQQFAMKASKPVKFTANENNLFGTLKYSEDQLANNTFTASENTLNRVDSNINQILVDGYKSGVGINEVSRQITERFDQLRTWEAKRIARTEIHTAQNMGVMNSYESLGVEYTQWIAASDDRTRESHVEIDREIIPIGGTYSNGLAFPGDTSGPIEEWINCRCSNAPFVLPAGMMAPSFSPFREEDLVPIETEPIQTEPQPVEEPQTMQTAPNMPYHINHEDGFSKTKISQECFESVMKHKNKRADAKIEWGNLVDLETGTLTHAKDSRGKSNGVVVQRPSTHRDFGLLHNHPINGGFSGADMYNQMTYRHQTVCFATTKDGLWIARDTEFGTFSKKNGGIHDSVAYEVRNNMNAKSREISREIYERKYKTRMQNAKTRKEYNAIKKEYSNDPEYLGRYNQWLLDTYGVGKNRGNEFEIEFIPNERLKDVQF